MIKHCEESTKSHTQCQRENKSGKIKPTNPPIMNLKMILLILAAGIIIIGAVFLVGSGELFQGFGILRGDEPVETVETVPINKLIP